MKQLLKKSLSNPIFVCGGIFLYSAAAMSFALVMQYFFDLQPCDLCILQRIPLVTTIVLGLAGLIFALNHKHLKICAFVTLLAALAFAVGGGLGFYHNGVEQHWWKSFLEGCRVTFPSDPQAMMDFIKTAKAVPCDAVPWSFLGLSMAGWNMIISPVGAVVCFAASILMARRANNFLD